MTKSRQSGHPKQPRQPRQRRVGLARAREAAGLTQEAFAVLAGVEVSTVVRWESGETTPLPGKRPRIARVLGVGLPELERLLAPGGSREFGGGFGGGFAGAYGGGFGPAFGPASAAGVGIQPAAALGGLAAIAEAREAVAKLAAEYEARPTAGSLVRAAALLERLEMLRGGAPGGGAQGGDAFADGYPGVAGGGSPAADRGGPASGGFAASQPTETARSLREAAPRIPSQATAPFPAVIPAPRAAADHVPASRPRPGHAPGEALTTDIAAYPAAALSPGPTPGRWRRDLDVAEAEAALLAGRLLWDAAGRRDAAEAAELFDRAARRAARAGDTVLQASAVLRGAFVDLYGGDPRAGLRRCVQAAVLASPVSPALTALARLHAAEGHALLGHTGECDRALASARDALSAVDAEDPAQGSCPPRTYLRLAGAAYLALGRHAEARAALIEAAARHEPGRTLAVVLGHLALACLGEGDLDAAVRHLRSVLDLVATAPSAGALAVAFRAGRDVARAADPARTDVAEIVDRLLGIAAAR